METLLQQLTEIILQERSVTPEGAAALAVKEVLFRGLSRWGLMKSYSWVPELDNFSGENFSVTLLAKETEGALPLDSVFPYLCLEFDAFGVHSILKCNGNCIEAVIPDTEKKVFFCFIQKDYNLKHVVNYKQTPLSYEFFSVTDMDHKVREELSNLCKDEIGNALKPEKATKTVKKSRTKKPKKESDELVQLSLFDF